MPDPSRDGTPPKAAPPPSYRRSPPVRRSRWAHTGRPVRQARLKLSLTYCGNMLTQYPLTLFAKDLVRGATFVIPLALVNWLPALHILGRDDPLQLPHRVDFCSPLVALAAGALAALA